MRFKIVLECLNDSKYWNITNKELQGFVYSLLRNTTYNNKHNENGFKYFTFSNIYPPTHYKTGEQKEFIISSMDSDLLKTMYESINKLSRIRLNYVEFAVKSVEWIKHNKKNPGFKISTPLVLYKDRRDYTYFSFKNKIVDYDFFFNRLKDNLLKKYNSFYNKEYETDEPLFVNYEYYKEVAHSLKNRHHNFLIIGSLWNYLEPNPNIHPSIYSFLYDVGLGEKNSLGYGFVNKVWRKR